MDKYDGCDSDQAMEIYNLENGFDEENFNGSGPLKTGDAYTTSIAYGNDDVLFQEDWEEAGEAYSNLQSNTSGTVFKSNESCNSTADTKGDLSCKN